MEDILFKIFNAIGLDEDQFCDAVFIMKENGYKEAGCISVLTKMGLMESEAIMIMEQL